MMKDGWTCPMHPKVPLIAGIAVIVFTFLGMYSMPFFLWLDILVGIALAYAGATGNCVMSGMMAKCCGRSNGTTGTDKVELP